MKKIWAFITTARIATGNLLFIALIGIIIFVVVSRETYSIPDSAVMIIDPEGVIVEQERAVDPVEQFLSGDYGQESETLGRDVIEAIRLAAEDERIRAIALDLSKLQGSSLALYEGIADALLAFKSSGKQIYAFGSSYTQSQYYLASFADEIYVDSDAVAVIGGVFLPGFDAYPIYLKSALDNLKITMHVIKAGTYKDAAEIFLRDDMSEFSRESNQELLNNLWDSYLSTITRQRGLTREAVSSYIEQYDTLIAGPDADPATVALEQGLVDELVTRVEWRDRMQAIAGESGDSYNHVDYRNYLSAVRPPIPVVNPASDKIAVIVAKGTILDGEQPAGEIGGDSVARLIRQARTTESIKAIVLRIDSPGGSPSASELIRSELAVAQASGKPVVASMGGYAASGGYWIASTANRIFAAETTVTGSIGVVATYPTFERSLAHLGINSDGIGTTPMSGAMNVLTEANPKFMSLLQSSVNRTYHTFLSLVAEGRGLSYEEVDDVSQGRVWSGARALEHGLVDAIGDLDDAIESAALLADVSDYDVVFLEKELSPREQLVRQLLETSVNVLPPLPAGLVSVVPAELRALAQLVKTPGLHLQCLSCRVSF